MAINTQKIKCPECGVSVTMPASYDGKEPEAELCNSCSKKAEMADNAS